MVKSNKNNKVEKRIVEIEDYIKKLSQEDQELIRRIYNIRTGKANIKIPKEIEATIKKKYGSLKKFKEQKIVRITNKITFEGSLFNELRTRIPQIKEDEKEELALIKKSEGGIFCNPLENTTESIFGRIKGKKSITAANIAAYDTNHSLVIFKEHDPLKVSEEEFIDGMKTAMKWIKKAHKEDKKAEYPFIMWNCLWKSGSSIIHPHLQVLLTKEEHYGRIEFYNEISKVYKEMFNKNYWDQVWEIHKKLGLGKRICRNKIKIMASMTPAKEKEVIILSNEMNEELMKAIHKVIRAYKKKLGVTSYNMGIYLPPINNRKDWELPIIARLVDRGSIAKKTADIGSMEMFTGQTIIASDPYKVIEKI